MAAFASTPWLRALRLQAYRWRERLGWPGLAALAAALAALVLGLAAGHARRGLAAEEMRLHEALRQLAAGRADARPAGDDLRAWPAALPPVSQRLDDVGLLMRIAREHGLSGARTEYRVLDARSDRIERTEVVLSAEQGFEPWRALLVDVLNQMPHAAVAGASWTRKSVDADATEARVSLLLLHRRQP